MPMTSMKPIKTYFKKEFIKELTEVLMVET
jgi:hypothetical protein